MTCIYMYFNYKYVEKTHLTNICENKQLEIPPTENISQNISKKSTQNIKISDVFPVKKKSPLA